MHGTAIATLLVGFVLGLQHATDTDHIVAVTTLASHSENPRHSALVGGLWGLGHMATLFIAGSVLIVLRLRMGARAEWALELIVALVLIWLGVHTIRNCFTGRYHFHAHEHGGRRHAHLHFHAHDEHGHTHDAHAGVPARLSHGPASVLVGMAHGLAGTGALALAVLTSIPSRLLGMIYLLVFGFGALVGMVAFSALVGLPVARTARKVTWLNAMRFAAGAGSALLGALLTYRAFLPPSFPF